MNEKILNKINTKYKGVEEDILNELKKRINNLDKFKVGKCKISEISNIENDFKQFEENIENERMKSIEILSHKISDLNLISKDYFDGINLEGELEELKNINSEVDFYNSLENINEKIIKKVIELQDSILVYEDMKFEWNSDSENLFNKILNDSILNLSQKVLNDNDSYEFIGEFSEDKRLDKEKFMSNLKSELGNIIEKMKLKIEINSEEYEIDSYLDSSETPFTLDISINGKKIEFYKLENIEDKNIEKILKGEIQEINSPVKQESNFVEEISQKIGYLNKEELIEIKKEVTKKLNGMGNY